MNQSFRPGVCRPAPVSRRHPRRSATSVGNILSVSLHYTTKHRPHCGEQTCRRFTHGVGRQTSKARTETYRTIVPYFVATNLLKQKRSNVTTPHQVYYMPAKILVCAIFISSSTFLFCALQSVENLRERLKDARRVLILGNGGIALELVHALASSKTCQVWHIYCRSLDQSARTLAPIARVQAKSRDQSGSGYSLTCTITLRPNGETM